MEELFARDFRSLSLYKLAQLLPDVGKIIGKLFFGIASVLAFVNMHVLPWVTKKQLPELPGQWLVKRLHPIIEQRQQTPNPRVDVLQLMLQVMTNEPVNVSCMYPFEIVKKAFSNSLEKLKIY